VSGVCLANRYRTGCTLSLPVGLVSGENNRRGYVRRSCSVGLMDGGSIPPGSTIWAAEIQVSRALYPLKSSCVPYAGTRLGHDFLNHFDSNLAALKGATAFAKTRTTHGASPC